MQLLAASLAPATQVIYRNIWNKFSAFCEQSSPAVSSLPADISTVLAFIAQQFDIGVAGSSITSYISVISFFHKATGLWDPTDSFLVKKVLRGARNITHHPDVRLPLTWDIIKQICGAIKYTILLFYDRVMFKAMLLLAFCAFCRIGEITFSKKSAANLLQYSNIMLDNNCTLQVTFEHFKHSAGKSFTLRINSTKSVWCPVAALVAYLKLRGSAPGALFLNAQGQPVTRSKFVTFLNNALCFFTSTSYQI